MLLEESELKQEWFEDCYCLHFCSVDLIECPMKNTHKKAIEYALQNKSIISFDPNVRLPLWDSEESSNGYKKSIATVIAHEFTHMWFGNLVTCKWWDYLFLNEGFARFYQYFAGTVVSNSNS